MRMRARWIATWMVAVSISGTPVAAGMPEESGPRNSVAVARAKTIQFDVSSRYLGSHGAGLEVIEASSSDVIESFTLVSPQLTEMRVVPADHGIYYAICPVRATCPYPARRFARSAATFLPRRLALELAVRTFRETTAEVVAVLLPTARFVLFVVERTDLAGDDLASLAKALGGEPRRSPSVALRALVDRSTRPHVFAVIGLEPTPSGRDSLAAVPIWPNLGTRGPQ